MEKQDEKPTFTILGLFGIFAMSNDIAVKRQFQSNH